MEQLDERKMKILQAIIRNYLETGEPVGSRTISKYTDLNLSSATIRNEMADLEEMGYILQPHTSAGRIPTDKGYRFYVDTVMSEKEETEKEHGVLLERVDKLENLLGEAVDVINEMMKDEPDCKYCLWEKLCASGRGKKECMKDAQWKHTGMALRLIGREDI